MVRDDDASFRPKLGWARQRAGAGRPKLFLQQVKHAVARAGGDLRRLGAFDGSAASRLSGRYNARGRGAKLVGSLPRDSGWSLDRDTGMRFRARRVVVKARIVKLRGLESRAVDAHLRYLQRDGVTRDGEHGRMYGPGQDEADPHRFAERGREDRHQFRLIVAPEDGAEYDDLRSVTRRLMAQMERDLETKLDWIAADHHDTGHPHSHIVIRGVTDDRKQLNIAGDYIAHGIRARASEIITLDLGPQSEWEVRQQLGREVDDDRFTRLDRALVSEADEDRMLDLRADREPASYLAQANRHLLVARLRRLERLGLADATGTGRWRLRDGMERTLRDLGERGDIIKTMHRALERRGVERSADQYAIDRDRLDAPVVGRLIDKGLAGDGLDGRLHLVVDGVDGRTHYVEVGAQADEATVGSIVEVGADETRTRAADGAIAALAREGAGVYRPSQHLAIASETVRVPGGDYEGYVKAHVRRLEALRRAGIVERLDADRWRVPDDYEQRALAYDQRRNRQIVVRILSVFDLDAQVTSDGATWLDRQLVGRDRVQPVRLGFGFEVGQAMEQRREQLVQRGDAQRSDDGRTRYRSDLLATLERRELGRVGRELERTRGVPFRTVEDGETVRGRYRQAVMVASGKFALIENAREFTLVPWRPVIEKELGREVTGLVRGGAVQWDFGRQRGLGI